MSNEEVIKKKWEKLLELAEKFKHIPFVDFVLVAGSMAAGEVHEKSDFDLIIGVRPGRIFTVRQLALGIFHILGVRRKGIDEKEDANDKVCLNHFIAPEEYRLDPPHNEYWVYLYHNLVPVYGEQKQIEKFFNANEWAGEIEVDYDLWLGNEKSFFRRLLEFFLDGSFGNIIERVFKKYQVWRIEKGLDKALGYKPQFKYNDGELRFHTDTKRIESWIEENS